MFFLVTTHNRMLVSNGLHAFSAVENLCSTDQGGLGWGSCLPATCNGRAARFTTYCSLSTSSLIWHSHTCSTESSLYPVIHSRGWKDEEDGRWAEMKWWGGGDTASLRDCSQGKAPERGRSISAAHWTSAHMTLANRTWHYSPWTSAPMTSAPMILAQWTL